MATIIQTFSGTPVNSFRVTGDDDTDVYVGQSFNATISGTLTSLQFFLRSVVGTPTDGVVVEVWSDLAGVPVAVISGASVTVPQANLVSTGGTYDVSKFTTATFSSPPTLVSGTSYWIIFYRPGATPNASNYNNIFDTSPGSYAGGTLSLGTSIPTTWANQNNDAALFITITNSAVTSGFFMLM